MHDVTVDAFDKDVYCRALRWWETPGSVERVLADLIDAELARLRPGSGPGGTASTATGINSRVHAPLEVDSLEHLQLATSVAELLQLHESAGIDALLTTRTLADWSRVVRRCLADRSEPVGAGRAAPAAAGAAMTFRTSGSTGLARACEHPLSRLAQEVAVHANLIASLSAGKPACDRFDGAPIRRLLVAVPSHHIYGFIWSVLLPAGWGMAAADVIDLRRMLPTSLASLARAGDIVVGHPTFWRAALRLPKHFAPGVLGVTSTEPCPPSVSQQAADLSLPLLHIYGSSETAGIGWRSAHADPYTLLPFWSRDGGTDDTDGTDNTATGLIRHDIDGATAPIAAPDALAWHSARCFDVQGRIDGAVQVGGVNVFPAYVGKVLRAHPQVGQAAVRLMRPDEGGRLKAFVVPREGNADLTALAHDLEQYVKRTLVVAERPVAFRFGDALPVGPNGKACDWPVN